VIARLSDLAIDSVGGWKFLVIAEGGGDSGKIYLYHFMSLDLVWLEGNVHITITGGQRWFGAQEPSIWDDKERAREPYLRMHNDFFLPVSLSALDKLETVDGSRFLASSVLSVRSTVYSLDPKITYAVIVDTADELGLHLPEVLYGIGVPLEDIGVVAEHIAGKLGNYV
jgi:hypothetical protein